MRKQLLPPYSDLALRLAVGSDGNRGLGQLLPSVRGAQSVVQGFAKPWGLLSVSLSVAVVFLGVCYCEALIQIRSLFTTCFMCFH